MAESFSKRLGSVLPDVVDDLTPVGSASEMQILDVDDRADGDVREIAVEFPAATRLFEQLGIDYCCGGHKPLAQACEERGLELGSVMELLDQNTGTSGSDKDWNRAPLGELIEHIVVQHHSYVKSEVPRLEALIARVKSVYGERHPEL